MSNSIDQVTQKARRYWYTDGLNEMALGSFCLILGLYFYLQSSVPEEGLFYQLLSAGFVLIVIAGVFGLNWTVNRLKERLTYPRTGYIGYSPRPKSARLVAAIMAMIIAALVIIVHNLSPVKFAWIPAFNSLVVAIGWGVAGYRVGLPRFFIMAAFSLGIGLIIAASGLDNLQGLAIFYTLLGVASLVAGGWTLGGYLKSTQSVQEGADE